jgi:hypothetical protein
MVCSVQIIFWDRDTPEQRPFGRSFKDKIKEDQKQQLRGNGGPGDVNGLSF